jgi:hypothetical protein
MSGPSRLHGLYHRNLPVVVFIAAFLWGISAEKLHIYPPIGTYIAVLAFLAAVVTVWPPEHPLGRAAWIFVFLLVMGFEVRNLYRDRTDRDREEMMVRSREAAQFRAIIDSLTASIQQNQKQFDATMTRVGALLTKSDAVTRIAKDSVDAVTGGDSYPEITIGAGHSAIEGVRLFAAIWKAKAAGAFTYAIQESPDESACGPGAPVIVRGITGTIAANRTVLVPGTLHPSSSKVNHYCVSMQ